MRLLLVYCIFVGIGNTPRSSIHQDLLCFFLPKSWWCIYFCSQQHMRTNELSLPRATYEQAMSRLYFAALCSAAGGEGIGKVTPLKQMPVCPLLQRNGYAGVARAGFHDAGMELTRRQHWTMTALCRAACRSTVRRTEKGRRYSGSRQRGRSTPG